ncbi:MAG: trypsin-like peptidase domain-containing protein [Gemmatimonadota bacterium]
MTTKLISTAARLGVPVLALLLVGCGTGEEGRAAIAQESGGPAAASFSAPSGEAPDLAPVRALSEAFRSASGRALPAVVFIGVERDAPTEMSGGDTPFERFFRQPGAPEGRPLPPQIGSGSGFIVDPTGRIVTNNHVITGATRITVRLHDGREYSAEVLASDPSTDIALLSIDTEGQSLPTVPWGDSDALLVGDWVLALGNPLGLEFSVTSGIVSARGRQLTRGTAALESYIQTDAAINPGNSGGPLVDLAGNVVGINSAIYGGDRFVGYGFAVPSSLARRVIRDLLEFGFVRRPRLGVRVSDVTAVDAEAYDLEAVTGADVNSVEAGSPADRAGLRVGDVVVALEGEPVDNSNALITMLAQRNPGDRVVLSVLRYGEEEELTVTLGEFDRATANPQRASAESTVTSVVGIQVRRLTREMASQLGYDRDVGVVVANVRPYGPAARAGVRAGQAVLAVNGERVESTADYTRLSGSVEPGEVVSLRVIDSDLGETIINFRTATG